VGGLWRLCNVRGPYRSMGEGAGGLRGALQYEGGPGGALQCVGNLGGACGGPVGACGGLCRNSWGPMETLQRAGGLLRRL